jgi:hypothetical protein
MARGTRASDSFDFPDDVDTAKRLRVNVLASRMAIAAATDVEKGGIARFLCAKQQAGRYAPGGEQAARLATGMS